MEREIVITLSPAGAHCHHPEDVTLEEMEFAAGTLLMIVVGNHLQHFGEGSARAWIAQTALASASILFRHGRREGGGHRHPYRPAAGGGPEGVRR